MENNDNKANDPQFRASSIPAGMQVKYVTAHCVHCGNFWPIPDPKSGPTNHEVVEPSCPKCESSEVYTTK
jgi:Zn finger protein HypA/HybF involved in hydrogenase expression